MAETTTTETVDIGKLTTQANELRGAMVEALGKADDSKVRKLGNELAQVNKSILDAAATSQVGERQAYMESMHDALNDFEIDGLTLTVKFNADDGVASIVYTPTPGRIDDIKAAVASIDRPSSATKWEYAWAPDDDGVMRQEFDFGKGAKRSTGTGGNGTRSMGWAKDGTDSTLGDAFEAVAKAKEKTEYATKTGGSAQHAYKSKVVTAAGYTKK